MAYACHTKEYQYHYRRSQAYRDLSRARSAMYVNDPEIKEARRVKREEKRNDPLYLRHLQWHATKTRAKKKGFRFTITSEEYIAAWPEDNLCKYCGQEMIRCTKQAGSADKVIPDFGYVAGNVDIICTRCNAHKNNHPAEWFEKIARRMREVEAACL